jgi:hypothetical protein
MKRLFKSKIYLYPVAYEGVDLDVGTDLDAEWWRK